MAFRIPVVFLVIFLFFLFAGIASADKGWYIYRDGCSVSRMAVVGSSVLCPTSNGPLLLRPDTGVMENVSDVNGIISNSAKMLTTSDGKLWVLSGGNISWIDTSPLSTAGKFTESDIHEIGGENAPPAGSITDYCISPDGSIWAAASQKLYHYQGTGWQRIDFDFPKITSIAVDGLGRIWVGWVETASSKIVPESQVGADKYVCSDLGARKTTGDQKYSSGLYMNDGAGWKALATFDKYYYPSVLIKAWKEDKVFVYCAGNNELYYYQGSERTTITSADGLPESYTAIINFGADGSPWVGTQAGICHLTFDGAGSIQTKTFTSSDGLPSDNILSIVSTADGKLIVGTDYGFGIYKNGRWSAIRPSGPIGRTFTQMVTDHNGAVWWGSDKGISRFQNGTWKTYTVKDGLAGNDITKLWLDSKERVCYASTSDDGGGYFENENWHPGAEKRSTDTISSDGTAWMLKKVNGESILYHKVNDIYTIVDNLGGEPIKQILAGPDSSVWVCSYYFARKYKNGIMKEYTQADGYPRGPESVFISPHGEVWAHTGWAFVKLEGETFKAITLQGHLPYPDFFEYVSFDPYNNLWYITYNGVARIDGDKVITYDPLEGHVRSLTVDDRGRLFVLSGNRVAWFWANSWHSVSNDTRIDPWQYGVFHVDPYAGELWYSGLGGLVRYVGEDVPVEESVRPVSSILCENYPNPFNPETLISYTLPQAGSVTVAIYNAAGQKITELAQGYHAAGKHTVIWNARGCASGVYFCSVREGKTVEIRKMLLMR